MVWSIVIQCGMVICASLPLSPSRPLEGEEHEGRVDEDTVNLLQNILVLTKR